LIESNNSSRTLQSQFNQTNVIGSSKKRDNFFSLFETSKLFGTGLNLLVKLRPGVNYTKILQVAFMHSDPQKAKNTVKPSVFIALLGSTHIKAAHKMLVK
jgi:hypothetical protein